MMAGTKRCSRCGKTKPVSEFCKNRRSKDGLHSYCKACKGAYSRAWAEANRERRRAQNREWSKAHLARRSVMQRSTRYGLAYSVTLELRARPCDICGALPGSGSMAHHIDHDNTTGAVRGVLCAHCNRGLGGFRDSPGLLARAAWYLARGADYRDVDTEA